MTSPTASTSTAERVSDQAAGLIDQGRRAAVDAVTSVTETWVDAWHRFTPAGGPVLPLMPVVPVEVVDRFFDTGVAVLEVQRALVHSMLGAATRPSR